MKKVHNSDFRQKSFTGFIKEHLSISVFLLLVLPLLIIGVLILPSEGGGLLGTVFILAPLPALFFASSSYGRYKYGRLALQNQNGQFDFVLEGIPTIVLGFSLSAAQKKFSTDGFHQIIYDFDRVDIAILENSIILLGSGKSFYCRGFSYPVEISEFGHKTPNHRVQLLSASITEEKTIIKIKDPAYKTPITLVFKAHINELKSYSPCSKE